MKTIVTGASGALGKVVCEHLGANGHDVAPIKGIDLSVEAQAIAAISELASGSGIRGLVNIAGGFAWETIADGSVDTWDRMWTLNVKTTLNSCRAALPYLQDGTSAIVNVGAAAAARATAGMGAYAASKAAVARLTEALGEELKHRDIRVNAILPSIIDTPANRADMPDADTTAWVSTEQLARAIAFLLSPDASGITATLLPVTGKL
jgi:NAD(P)-dependent dehydrogenase (short-subunit alcohol dehydrogenase family)